MVVTHQTSAAIIGYPVGVALEQYPHDKPPHPFMPSPTLWLIVLCQQEGVLTPCDLFSHVKTANKMRSMLVLSWKVPIGRVLRLISRKRRSTALVVRTARRSASVL